MRLVVFIVLVLAAIALVWYLLSQLKGRSIVADTPGKILVALIIAGLAFWLFGGGALLPFLLAEMGATAVEGGYVFIAAVILSMVAVRRIAVLAHRKLEAGA